jgi:hypothetical protein
VSDKSEQKEHSLLETYLKIGFNILIAASMISVAIWSHEAGAPTPILALMIATILLSCGAVSDKKGVNYYNMSTNRALRLLVGGSFIFASFITWIIYEHLHKIT